MPDLQSMQSDSEHPRLEFRCTRAAVLVQSQGRRCRMDFLHLGRFLD